MGCCSSKPSTLYEDGGVDGEESRESEVHKGNKKTISLKSETIINENDKVGGGQMEYNKNISLKSETIYDKDSPDAVSVSDVVPTMQDTNKTQSNEMLSEKEHTETAGENKSSSTVREEVPIRKFEIPSLGQSVAPASAIDSQPKTQTATPTPRRISLFPDRLQTCDYDTTFLDNQATVSDTKKSSTLQDQVVPSQEETDTLSYVDNKVMTCEDEEIHTETVENEPIVYIDNNKEERSTTQLHQESQSTDESRSITLQEKIVHADGKMSSTCAPEIDSKNKTLLKDSTITFEKDTTKYDSESKVEEEAHEEVCKEKHIEVSTPKDNNTYYEEENNLIVSSKNDDFNKPTKIDNKLIVSCKNDEFDKQPTKIDSRPHRAVPRVTAGGLGSIIVKPNLEKSTIQLSADGNATVVAIPKNASLRMTAAGGVEIEIDERTERDKWRPIDTGERPIDSGVYDNRNRRAPYTTSVDVSGPPLFRMCPKCYDVIQNIAQNTGEGKYSRLANCRRA